ncbi:MAG: glycerol-3-phosphate dehydrogenase subunit GlpB [Anaerolineae bacterium]
MEAATLDVVVIGAGLAGLMAGWQSAVKGCRVRVVAKGWGTTHWHAGCIDVLGYYPADSRTPVEAPAEALADLMRTTPQHPYARVGMEALVLALDAFQQLCAAAGYPMHGSLERNWLLPTALGGVRPTCLAPETMIAGDLRRRDPMLLVGFRPYLDFYPALAADNLSVQGFPARDVTLDLPRPEQRRLVNATNLAQLFERADFRAEVADALKPHLGDAARVGFPAVLGLHNALGVQRDLQERLGRPVFEIPVLPPSVPGMRLHRILTGAIERAGGRVFEGMEVVAADVHEKVVEAVWTQAAARRKLHRARHFVLATGGILGSGIVAEDTDTLREVIFNLPLAAVPERDQWFDQEFLSLRGHPIYRAGIAVNERLQPLDAANHVLYANLYVVGTTLAHCDALLERSFEGVALSTGFVAAQQCETTNS